MAKQKQHRSKTPLRMRISALLSLPPCTVRGIPYIELQGDGSLSLTGYERLLQYEEGSLLFRMCDVTGSGFTHLHITGEHLVLDVIKDGSLRVTGRIDAVLLHPRGIAVC